MKRCLVCGGKKITTILDLGKTALANKFLTKDEIKRKKENFYSLKLCVCNDCYHVQLDNLVDPKLMFDDYLYVSSASTTLVNHLKSLAKEITRITNLDKSDLVVDIGSNDGCLLRQFLKIENKLSLVGVEPAKNLTSLILEKEINCLNNYLDLNVSNKIIEKFGKAKVITSTNNFPHIHNLDCFMESVENMMHDNGVFVIEAHYLLDLLQQFAFDTIYHEHVSYWALTPMQILFEKYNMCIFNVERLPIHHGQIRVWIKKKINKTYKVSNSLNKLIELEEKFGLNDIKTYKGFSERIISNKNEFIEKLNELILNKKKVVGYGAPAKGNTLLTFFNITKDVIPYICDKNKLKQNRFSPGQHIPIVSEDLILKDKPDYVLILAWNFTEEIIRQLSQYKNLGGKFIIPIPSFKII